MSSITIEQLLTERGAVEHVWATWLVNLAPWDRRTVFKHELEWHDLFCSGEWSWPDLQQAILEARGEVAIAS